jgi:hypothetical protein
MNLQESIRRILRKSLESEWNEGNYDYQYGFCHYFAYNIIDKIRERFPKKKVNYYLLLANEVNKDTDEVEQDYLLHVYIKIGDKLLDSNGFTTMDEVKERVDDWYNRQLTIAPEEYDINVWEEESDEIPEMFFNNQFCNTKRVKEDMDKFLSHPSVKKLLKDTLNESKSSQHLKLMNNLLDPFKEEDCICDIKVSFDVEENNYNVYLVFSQEELHDKFSDIYGIRGWIRKMRDDIKKDLEAFLPISNIFIGYYTKPHCGWSPLNESENKKEKSLESLEKSVKNFINMNLEEYDLPEEFYKVAVDVFDNEYDRKECTVTMLFEKPFKLHDSDRMHDIMNEIKKEIKEYFGDTFWYIKLGTSTVDVYNSTKDWYTKRKKNITESENKKSGLFRAIEEDGLYQVMQDTGLTLPQIYTKTGELPREVFVRYIKDFLNQEGYHQTNGSVVLPCVIELHTNVYIENFYLERNRVTLEINEYGRYGQQETGFIESISNLSDEELFTIVDKMTMRSENP